MYAAVEDPSQETILNELHTAAREYAQRGYAIFPCVPGTKVPATERGFHEASTDVEQIDAWWTENPNYNPAFCPDQAGLAVIDPDGADGRAAWFQLQLDKGAIETYTVDTPRGGQHLYFVGSLPPSVGKLADHVDTRGRGSYALLPPSRLDGWPEPYKVTDARDPALLPEWISETAAGWARDRAQAADIDLDLPTNIKRARKLLTDYVQRQHVAVEGEMGDARTYAVCCEVLNFGLTEDTALDLIDEVWNPHCQPPWERDDLATKLANAAAYAQNETGAWAVAPAAEMFKSVLDKLDLTPDPDEPGRRSRFYPFSEDEQDTFTDPVWLFPDLLPEDATVLLFGESGTFKSFLATDMGLTLASGIAGWGADPRDPVDVVMVAGEGARGVGKKRRPAWRIAHEIDSPIRFHIVDAMPLFARDQEVIELVEAIQAKGIKPKLVILDTLARAMAGMNENDAKDAGIFVEGVDMIKRALGCTVLVVHHSGKDTARGARGSSALQAGFDAAFEVKRPGKAPLVAVYTRKMKDADEREEPWCFEGKDVGPSLVFYPISHSAFRSMTAADDGLTASKVGKALAKLKAIGEDAAVTSSVLAAELHPPKPGETPEERQEVVDRMAKALRKSAGGSLAAYCTGEGQALKWWMPGKEG